MDIFFKHWSSNLICIISNFKCNIFIYIVHIFKGKFLQTAIIFLTFYYFQNLKHNFQDDIHMLHNVNSAYHKISRKDLDVRNCLQTRVLSANDRWHILYKTISDSITIISHVLQSWAEYEQLHQHLHLFLTETHIKVTSLESSGEWKEDEWSSIMVSEIFE